MKTRPVGERPIQIFTRKLERELDRHPGKWVAHTRTKLIAVGDSAMEAGTRAKELGYEQFFLWRLPAENEEWFF